MHPHSVLSARPLDGASSRLNAPCKSGPPLLYVHAALLRPLQQARADQCQGQRPASTDNCALSTELVSG